MSEADVFSIFEAIYRGDVKFLILKALSEREGASLRQLARMVGISHKNLSKHLEHLIDRGLVEYFEASSKMKVYRLGGKGELLRDLFKRG